MTSTSFRFSSADLALALVTCTSMATAMALTAVPARAVTAAAAPLPPDVMVTSPGGVDLRSGNYAYSKQDLAIGDPARGGIVLKRGGRTMAPEAYPDAFGQFSNSWDIHVYQPPSAPTAGKSISITSEGVSYNFFASYNYTSFLLKSLTGFATLSRSVVGSTIYWVLTTSNGTVVNFTNSRATKMTKPDGVVYTLNYDVTGLRSVVSTAGYALLFENSGGSRSLILKSCVLNLGQVALSSTCPAGVATSSYSYIGNKMIAAVDANGTSWGYSSTSPNYSSNYTDKYFYPGDSNPYLTVDYTYYSTPVAVTKQTFADGHYYDYTWTEETIGCAPGVTDCAESVFVLGSGYSENGVNNTATAFYVGPYSGAQAPKVSPGPTSVTDPLNRTYVFSYCDVGSCIDPKTLLGKTSPEGVKETYTYDAYRHINQREISAKAGSGLANITTGATYGNCSTSNLVACDSPTAIIDGKGNQTDYTHSLVHGGILTETAPAVGGIRPQKRYVYAQRYAWIKNGASYVRAAPPIWVLTQMSLCKIGAASGAGCAIAGDEVLTTYDYGPDSGPNNLLLRGKVEDASGLALRTCYGYDAQGRKVSETKPRASLGSCP